MRPLRAVLVAAAIVSAWAAGRAGGLIDEFARWRDGGEEPPAIAAAMTPPRPDEGFAWVPPPVGARPAPAPQIVILREPFLVPVGGRSAPASSAPAAPVAGWMDVTEPETFDMPYELAVIDPEPTPAPDPNLDRQAFALAEQGYSRLATGDRRGAANAFRVASSMAPAHASARLWRAERARLERRWRLEGYALLREAGDTVLPAASPVLGGGSSSFTLGFTPRPLARRPIELFARASAAQGDQGVDQASLQGALGVGWRPFARLPLTISAERLFKLGDGARDDWAARIAGGAATRWRGLDLAGYGEAGVVGKRPDWFAGAQFTAERRGIWREVRWAAGAGIWGAAQDAGVRVTRVDAGPLIRLAHPKTPVTVQIDYRLNVAGNAAPGSGPAVTVSGAF